MDKPKFDDEVDEYNYYHSLCPKCFGEDFDEPQKPIAFSNPKQNPNKYTCKNCGWVGYQRQFLPVNLEGVK
jgi:hypothetical protein